MGCIRRCSDHEHATILAIVNSAAEAYRGVIPADRWHKPYMGSEELAREMAAGVDFWGYEADGTVLGVMGIQHVRDTSLIRHAYVLPTAQRRGVGGELLEHLQRLHHGRMLVGTWAAATWAIRFYQRHGFELVSPELTATLLKSYWTIPDRQIETSVVLCNHSAASGLTPAKPRPEIGFQLMEIVRLEQREAFITADGSSIRELAGVPSGNAGNQSLAEAVVPRASATIAHLHRRSEEIYLFTAGSGRMRLGDEERTVNAGDCVVIPPGTPHKLWAGEREPLILLCCCAPAYSDEDTVLLEG